MLTWRGPCAQTWPGRGAARGAWLWGFCSPPPSAAFMHPLRGTSGGSCFPALPSFSPRKHKWRRGSRDAPALNGSFLRSWEARHQLGKLRGSLSSSTKLGPSPLSICAEQGRTGSRRGCPGEARGAWQGSDLSLPSASPSPPCHPQLPPPAREGDRWRRRQPPQPSSKLGTAKVVCPQCSSRLRQGNYLSPASFFMFLFNKIIIDGLIHLSHNQNSSQDGAAGIISPEQGLFSINSQIHSHLGEKLYHLGSTISEAGSQAGGGPGLRVSS